MIRYLEDLVISASQSKYPPGPLEAIAALILIAYYQYKEMRISVGKEK